MKHLQPKRIWASLGVIAVILLLGFAVFRAYLRGAHDFGVFYEAWRLVLAGRGSEIYAVSPDRFLYSPGFAWILSPLGLFPSKIALGIWCFLKLFSIYFLISLCARWASRIYRRPWREMFWVGLWGVILVARPLLIDFEYGQVNLLILMVCFWGLFSHLDPEISAFRSGVSWFLLTIAAVAKLFPIPLVIVPWLVSKNISPKKLWYERISIGLAFVVSLLLPILSLGWRGTWKLFFDWKMALVARGLPLETHNQSITALLFHYLSGTPTYVISEGMRPIHLGYSWLTFEQIHLLALFWSFTSAGVLLAWLIRGPKENGLKWITSLIGLMIIPSHLVWKPYFVMSLPMAVFLVFYAQIQALTQRRRFYQVALVMLFIGINLTGFDFIGHQWAMHLEAASVLMMMHLLMLVLVRVA